MKILRIIFYVLIFFFSIIVFLPKDSLYYAGEKILSKYNIVISNEKLTQKRFGLHLTDGIVTYGETKILMFEKSDILFFGFYNSITIKSIKNMSFLSSFLPQNTKQIIVKYSLYNPLAITFDAIGDFGKADGKYNLFSGKLNIWLTPSSQMKQKYSFILSQMKNNNGVFTYEQKL